jgi:hypothetical protein
LRQDSNDGQGALDPTISYSNLAEHFLFEPGLRQDSNDGQGALDPTISYSNLAEHFLFELGLRQDSNDGQGALDPGERSKLNSAVATLQIAHVPKTTSSFEHLHHFYSPQLPFPG